MTTSHRNYAGLILFIALLGAGVSVWLNTQFAASIANAQAGVVSFVLLWIVFDLAKFAGPYGFGLMWNQAKYGIAFTIAAIVIATTTFSIFAGQAFMANAFDDQNTARLQASDAYQDQRTAKQTAQERASALAVSPDAVTHAQSELARLQAEQAAFLASNATNSAGTRVGNVQSVIDRFGCKGFYSTYCSQRNAFDAEMRPHEETLRKADKYQAALANLERVNSEPTAAPVTGIHNPGFMLVSKVFGVDPGAVEAHLLLSMSIVAEAISGAFFLVFGLLTGRRVFSHEEIMAAVQQYHAMQQQHRDANTMLAVNMTPFIALPKPQQEEQQAANFPQA